MTEKFLRIVRTKEEGFEAAKHLYLVAKMLIAEGKPVCMSCAEDEDDIGTKQRNFLHKAVLTQIAEHVTLPDGTRYAMRVWKEFYRDKFLGSTWVTTPVIGKFWKGGRPAMRRYLQRNSTEDLGAKSYSKYIDQVIDDATLNWNVQFRFAAAERDEVRYVAPKRKAREAVPA